MTPPEKGTYYAHPLPPLPINSVNDRGLEESTPLCRKLLVLDYYCTRKYESAVEAFLTLVYAVGAVGHRVHSFRFVAHAHLLFPRFVHAFTALIRWLFLPPRASFQGKHVVPGEAGYLFVEPAFSLHHRRAAKGAYHQHPLSRPTHALGFEHRSPVCPLRGQPVNDNAYRDCRHVPCRLLLLCSALYLYLAAIQVMLCCPRRKSQLRRRRSCYGYRFDLLECRAGERGAYTLTTTGREGSCE